METGEECDDANRTGGDGCSCVCRMEDGYTCSSATPGAQSTCTNQPASGKECCFFFIDGIEALSL